MLLSMNLQLFAHKKGGGSQHLTAVTQNQNV